MLNFAILALLASNPRQDPQSADVVKLLGRDVPITFPANRVEPLNGVAEAGGWKWAANTDGTVGRRFKTDGGWGDIKDLYLANKPGESAKPYPVKVIVIQHSSTLRKSPVGVVRHEWATIDEDELDTVLSSLATLKGAVQAATSGQFDVRLDVTLDDDIYTDYRALSSVEPSQDGQVGSVTALDAATEADEGLGRGWLARRVAPRLNDERFETDDGTYSGPFAAVYVIHPRLDLPDRVWMVDNTPVTTLGYYTFSQSAARAALPTALFEAWKAMVWPSPGRRFSIPDDGLEVVSGALWQNLALRSLRSVRRDAAVTRANPMDSAVVERSRLGTIALDDAFEANLATSPADPSRSIVSAGALDYLVSKGTDLVVTGWGANRHGAFAEIDAPTTQLEPQIRLSAANGRPAPPLPTTGEAVGDFAAKPVTGPEGAAALEISFLKSEPRGYVVLASGDPVAKTGVGGALTFAAKLSVDENVVIELLDRSGKVIGSALLAGDMMVQSETPDGSGRFDATVSADDQWHTVNVPLDIAQGSEVTEVRLRGGEDRVSRGQALITVTIPRRVDMVLANEARRVNPAITIARFTSPISAEQSAQVSEALRSSNLSLRLTALDVLARLKAPETVLAVGPTARSGFAPVAAMGLRALAYQGTPDAMAIVREAVERGPFDHNRRFAAAELVSRPDPAMAASLNYLSARSWQARLESARALAAIKATSAEIILAAMLQTEPSPCVRLQIARTADPSVQLVARRLLYTAVNDSSQWVRAAALTRLIDVADKAVREEALNGVKDDAVGVRLVLLETMRHRAKEEYRPALRIAVVDTDPRVRAAALKAFATQPGPVDPNEVKNTWADSDPDVKAALAELVKAKGLRVPPQ